MQALFQWVGVVPYRERANRLTVDLHEGTRDIRRQMRFHSFMQNALFDSLEASSYQQYIVDLSLVYSVLENGIRTNIAIEPELKKIYFPTLERSLLIERDLESLSFDSFPRHTSEVSLNYARHLSKLGEQEPLLLAAHAYVHYLGNLADRLILKRVVENKWPDALNFYDFSSLSRENESSSLDALIGLYKEGFDNLVMNDQVRKTMLNEAKIAFEYLHQIYTPSS